MKKTYFLLLALCLFTSVTAQIINFPDANFKAKLLASNTTNEIAKDINGNKIKIDANNNGEIEFNEALNVFELWISFASISSLDGIENFTNLKTLNCSYNQITNLDFTGLNNLKTCSLGRA